MRKKSQVVEMRRKRKVAAIEAKEEDGDQEGGKEWILIGCKYIFYIMSFINTCRFLRLCQLSFTMGAKEVLECV